MLCLSCHNCKMNRQRETQHYTNHTHFHIFVLSSFVLLSVARRCLPSPRSVRKSAEPFHKPVNSGSEPKRSLSNLDHSLLNPPVCCQLSIMRRPNWNATWWTYRATRHPSESWCFTETTHAATKRELVLSGLWPPCVERQNILCCLG